MTFPKALDVSRRDDNDIDGGADAMQIIVNPARQGATLLSLLHDQQIDVAVRPHAASGGGTKQNNLLGFRCLDDAANHIVEDIRITLSTISISVLCGGA